MTINHIYRLWAPIKPIEEQKIGSTLCKKLMTQLDQVTYLDYAGAALPTPEFLQMVAKSLTDESAWLANPHSNHRMGKTSKMMIEKARSRVLAHFGVDPSQYTCIFTSNATSALKLLAENFVYQSMECATKSEESERLKRTKRFDADLSCLTDSSKTTLMMLTDSHTSVLGMRQIGSFDRVVTTDYEELEMFLMQLMERKQNCNGNLNLNAPTNKNSNYNLFVLTGMSNFCGRIYDLKLALLLKQVLGSHWKVCVDAAALATYTSNIGLGVQSVDFAVVSFYKMFGYPTGLGALLVSNGCNFLMQKHYFGGGTVNFASFSSFDVYYRNEFAERYEDGTPNMYAIRALLLAFESPDKKGV